MKRRIVRGFISVLSSQTGALITSLIATPILVRLLGSSNYGDFAVITSVFGIIMVFVTGGIMEGPRKFLAENRQSEFWMARVFGFYLKLSVILGIGGVILLILASGTGLASSFFGAGFNGYFLILALIVPAHQLFNLSRSTLLGLGLEHYSEILRVFDRMVFSIMAISFVYVGYGVVGVLLGQFIGLSVAAMIGIFFVTRRIDIKSSIQQSITMGDRKKFLEYNGMSIILIFLQTSLFNVDVLLLHYFRDSVSTGYYKAALTIAEFLLFVPAALQMVMLHSSSELWSKNKLSAINTYSGSAVRYSLLVTGLISIGIAVLARSFIPLYYGEEFSRSVGPILLLLPGTVGLSLAQLVSSIGQGKGSLPPLVIATGSASLLNLILNLLLIPQFGISGAAVATSISYSAMFVFHVGVGRMIGFEPLRDARILRVLLTIVLSILPIYWVSTFIEPVVANLLFTPPLGGIIFLLLALSVGAIEPKELHELASEIPYLDTVFLKKRG